MDAIFAADVTAHTTYSFSGCLDCSPCKLSAHPYCPPHSPLQMRTLLSLRLLACCACPSVWAATGACASSPLAWLPTRPSSRHRSARAASIRTRRLPTPHRTTRTPRRPSRTGGCSHAAARSFWTTPAAAATRGSLPAPAASHIVATRTSSSRSSNSSHRAVGTARTQRARCPPPRRCSRGAHGHHAARACCVVTGRPRRSSTPAHTSRSSTRTTTIRMPRPLRLARLQRDRHAAGHMAGHSTRPTCVVIRTQGSARGSVTDQVCTHASCYTTCVSYSVPSMSM